MEVLWHLNSEKTIVDYHIHLPDIISTYNYMLLPGLPYGSGEALHRFLWRSQVGRVAANGLIAMPWYSNFYYLLLIMMTSWEVV